MSDLACALPESHCRKTVGALAAVALLNTGKRLIVDVESGKPTVQLQKVLDLLDILGLEVVIQPKTSRTL